MCILFLSFVVTIIYQDTLSAFARMERQTREKCYPIDRQVTHTLRRDSFRPVLSEYEIFGGCHLERGGTITELCLLSDGSGLYRYFVPWDARFETQTKQVVIAGKSRTVTEKRYRQESDESCTWAGESTVYITKDELDYLLGLNTPPE